MRRGVGVYERIVRRFTAQTTDYQRLLSTFAEGLYTEVRPAVVDCAACVCGVARVMRSDGGWLLVVPPSTCVAGPCRAGPAWRVCRAHIIARPELISALVFMACHSDNA